MTYDAITHILDQARWAPSGDNTQPWRFQVVDAHHFVVHGFDTRDHCVYDLDGRPSQMSLGALLETIRIAATTQGQHATWTRRADYPDTTPVFDVALTPDATLRADPMSAYVTSRCVQRRALRMRALADHETQALQAAAGNGYRVVWLQGLHMKLRAAYLLFSNTKLRLTLPEAYRTHRNIVQWNARFSEDRIPDQAMGIDPLTARLMHFVMYSWQRVEFFNRFLAGTWMPRIQMDLVPGLACAAHCIIAADRPARTLDDYIDAGRAMQRFWLCATQLGLQLQPEMTPLIFARYARDGVPFSAQRKQLAHAQALEKALCALVGDTIGHTAVFMARIGAGPAATARSTRLPLTSLILP